MVSGECEECGGRVWDGIGYEPHSDAFHASRRRVWMDIVAQRLRKELACRTMAHRAAKFDCVLLVWRVALPDRVMHFRDLISGEFWDEDSPFREAMLAEQGRGIRDTIEIEYGCRPHPMQVKYRVFDGRRP